MPFRRDDTLNCFVCNVTQFASQMSRIDNDDLREIALSRRLVMGRQEITINEATRLCFTCKVSILNEIRALEENPQCLRLNVVTPINRHCFICSDNMDVVKLSLECRLNIFVDYDIYVSDYVKCCRSHLDTEEFIIAEIIPNIRFINRPIQLSGSETKDFLDGLRSKTVNSQFNGNVNRFTDEEFEYLTSINKNQFSDLYSFCERILIQDRFRHVSKKDLLTFMVKIRHNLTDDMLKIIFGYTSRQAVSMVISKVRQSLMRRFVPENISLQAMTRERFIEEHVTEFANEMYNPEPEVPRAIAYIDGSYTYVNKSTNFQALRQSYCVHKNRHLVKPQLIVGPDGYILDIQGPYFSDARNNDAQMLQNEFERNTAALREWFRENDILILDRGYRDALPLLTGLGITARIPPSLQRNEMPLNTEAANESRLITKTRWIVETRNGHLKYVFKFFRDTVISPHVLTLGDFYKIAGGLINRYHGPVLMQGADAQFAQELLQRSQAPNVVQARVEVDRLRTRRAQWIPLTSNDVPDFPRLSMDYLRDITVGTYQLRLAPSYVQDKLLREDDISFKIDSTLDEPGFMRVSLYSRYRNATKYQLWIAYETEASDEPILGHYCTCKSGARTLGCCSHIASVLWFLGHARHTDNVWYPDTAFLGKVLDAGHRPIRPRNPNIMV